MPLHTSYTKPLTAKDAQHLLLRTTFGFKPAQLSTFTGITADAALKILLKTSPTPAPPVSPDTGQTFHDKPFDPNQQGKYVQGLRNWFCANLASQETNIHEKLLLFWHNHFVVAYNMVADVRFMYDYYLILRKNALGNFRNMIIQITKCPAMLQYLNGDTNEVGKPNENYARELLELFTIGVGNYTEEDVKTAAQVLTGWKPIGFASTDLTVGTAFNVPKHDSSDKNFSDFFQKTTIKGRKTSTAGDEELAELVEMILKQPETARYMVRELYRWFINYDITPTIEKEFIEPMAKIFRDNNYEMLPLLTAMFQSEHFFDSAVRGCIIKSPLDLIVGLFRYFNFNVPPISNLADYVTYTKFITDHATIQQQSVFDHPTVFGWKPYYDTGFYEIWINSTTLSYKGFLTDVLIAQGVGTGTAKIQIDSLTLAQNTKNPADAEKMLDEWLLTLFAVELVKQQKDFLIDTVLMQGAPRYEWYNIWTEYTANPTNQTKRTAAKGRLDLLLLFLFRMAEFQMM